MAAAGGGEDMQLFCGKLRPCSLNVTGDGVSSRGAAVHTKTSRDDIGQMRMEALLLEHEQPLEHEKLAFHDRGLNIGRRGGARLARGLVRRARSLPGETKHRSRELGDERDTVFVVRRAIRVAVALSEGCEHLITHSETSQLIGAEKGFRAPPPPRDA